MIYFGLIIGYVPTQLINYLFIKLHDNVKFTCTDFLTDAYYALEYLHSNFN